MRPKIAYYFEPIEERAAVDDLPDLIDLHTRSFERNGWDVVWLNEAVARQHPLYGVFDDADSIFATSRNSWIYTRACYMRWLAYAEAGHFFADFDVMNYGFTPEDAYQLRQMAGGATFLSGAGAAGLFQGSDYDAILQTFLRYGEKPFIDGVLTQDVNDMTILVQCRPDLFSLLSSGDLRIAQDYSRPGWETTRLVHYPYHYVQMPRSKTVREQRSPI